MNLGFTHPLFDRLPYPLKALSDWAFSTMHPTAQSATTRHIQSDDGQSGSDQCKQSLIAVIEGQILPRLLNAHAGISMTAHAKASDGIQPTQDEIHAFAIACLGFPQDNPLRMAQTLMDKGVSRESIFLGLITPAARQLGEWWEQDHFDFTQVSQGLVLMHQVTRDLGFNHNSAPQIAGDIRRIMLACAPGSQHILGITILADFFRVAGWQVVVEISSQESELLRSVQHEWFDMVGLSVGLIEQLPTLPKLIEHLRTHSKNPQSVFILGGAALLSKQHHPTTKHWGADGISTDAAEAVQLANRLIQAA
jgi:methanogenic corrinoid protein MtbC1